MVGADNRLIMTHCATYPLVVRCACRLYGAHPISCHCVVARSRRQLAAPMLTRGGQVHADAGGKLYGPCVTESHTDARAVIYSAVVRRNAEQGHEGDGPSRRELPWPCTKRHTAQRVVLTRGTRWRQHAHGGALPSEPSDLRQVDSWRAAVRGYAMWRSPVVRVTQQVVVAWPRGAGRWRGGGGGAERVACRKCWTLEPSHPCAWTLRTLALLSAMPTGHSHTQRDSRHRTHAHEPPQGTHGACTVA